ncbi:MAG: hypothetical protein ACREL1_09540, partial [bacterium]
QAPHSAPAVPAIPPGSLLEDLVKSSAPTLAAVPAPVAAPAAPPIPAVPSVSKAPVESAPAYGAPVVPTPPQPASLPPLTKQAPTLDKPVAASLDDLLASPKPPPPASAPAAPVEKASAPNVPGGGLDDFFSTTIAKPKLPTIDPVTPVKPNPGVSISGASPLASLGLEKPPMPSLDPGFSDLKSPTAAPRSEKDKPAKEKKPGRISRLMKSRVRVAKVKIPFLVLVVLVLALLGAGGIVVAFAGGAPTLQILNTLAPLQIVQMDSGEVTDMDITTYSDIQSNLQAMHFNDFLQMTVPQLPAPNFFDVQMKSKAFTYAEIIKMPGDLTPVLSYVTVFTNGVWYSTNGWAGKDHNMSYLVSGFYPNDDPNQLYAVHIQGLNQLESDNGWEPETMGQNRYMSALTDHLRWYLNLKGLAGYQAQFADWH